MTTEFPKDHRYLGKDLPQKGNVKFNKDKEEKASLAQEAKASDSDQHNPTIKQLSLPPDQILNHLAANSGIQRANLQHEASLNLFTKMVRSIESVIEKEFPNQNLSSKARERIALGVINKLMDNQQT